jgi:uncharacterized protein (DUF1015 family)
MVEIKPFKAIRYTKKAGNYEKLIAQPYDKIDQHMQKEYYKKSEYNFCRVTFPIEENRYVSSKTRLSKWLKEGILKKDNKTSIFIYKQEFELDKKKYIRTGFIAAFQIHPYKDNKVIPHEITYDKPKTDRLKMLKATQKNLEPIFIIYSDENKKTKKIFERIIRDKPLIEVIDSKKVKNIIWQVTNSEIIESLQKAVKDSQFIIADGHHRYESAIQYRNERIKIEKNAKSDFMFNYCMGFMIPAQDEGLIILPSHRLLKKIRLTKEIIQKLKKIFHLIPIGSKSKDFKRFLEKHENQNVFCIYDGKKAYGLILKEKVKLSRFRTSDQLFTYASLNIIKFLNSFFKEISHKSKLVIDEDIIYSANLKNAIKKVNSGKAKIAFLINPIRLGTIMKITKKNERTPEKSTEFYPKIVSGLTIMDLSDKSTSYRNWNL